MSLVFMDSFDHYSSGQLLWKWDSIAGTTATVSVSAAAGRRNTAALQLIGSGSNSVTKTVCALSSYVVGLAFKMVNANTINRSLLNFMDDTIVHLELSVSTSGKLAITRGIAGTVLSSSDTVLNTGTFYYIEMKAEISNSISAGGVEVKINGVSAMTLPAGTDTQNLGNAEIDGIRIGPQGNAGSPIWTIDDLYIIDTLGQEMSNFLGDIRVDALLISAEGTLASWSPSSAGATMLSMIASQFPDSGTTYMFASAASDSHRFSFSGLESANGSIYGIQLNLAVAKSDTTSVMQVAGLFFSGTVSGIGSTTTVGNTSYVYVMMPTSADASGASWSSNTINKTQFGIKII